MFSALREALYCLKAGVASLNYPSGMDIKEPVLPPFNYRGLIRFDLRRCSVCKSCVGVCPARLLSVSDEEGRIVFRAKWTRCLMCGNCRQACPEGAISFARSFENTAGSMEELEEYVCLEPADVSWVVREGN